MMTPRASVFLYPWDVVGDPAAPRRIAELGVRQVTLAAAYHSTRAVTPRHPRHRIVTARHSAVLYPPDERRWAGRTLRPYPQDWVDAADPFGAAAEALAGAGLEVHSWVVLAHNSRLGAEHPDTSVVNAHGDRYPWAPCIGRPEVRDYLVRLAAEAATRPGARGCELESCGWYGLAHLHAHDKIAGVALDGAGQLLMSLCFCDRCRDGYAAYGADPEDLRAAVTAALLPYWDGVAAAPPAAAEAVEAAGAWARIVGLLGEGRAAAVLGWRRAAATRLQREAVAAVRSRAQDSAFRVLLHATPEPYACGANAGVDPAEVLTFADGLVLPCTGGPATRTAALEPCVPHRRPHTTLAANLTVVSGMGGTPATLAEDAAHAAELGADELRLYHGGLASAEDLARVAEALGALGA
ncbi:hypothetical protein [Streptomyces sp. 184]|uniref:hypothetical protein n=1 Tax=Streptomyces sp. 184 TaxID=1827526 RepID=UPI003891C779